MTNTSCATSSNTSVNGESKVSSDSSSAMSVHTFDGERVRYPHWAAVPQDPVRDRSRVASAASARSTHRAAVTSLRFLLLPSRSARPTSGGSSDTRYPSSTTPAEPRRPPPDESWRERLEALAPRLVDGMDAARSAGRGLSRGRVAIVVVAVLTSLRPSAPVRRSKRPCPWRHRLPGLQQLRHRRRHRSSSCRRRARSRSRASTRSPATGRVNDLIAAAGGLAADADPDQVELAAPLTDGERVYVPRVGESPPLLSGSRQRHRAGAGRSISIARMPPIWSRSRASGLRSAQAIIDHRAAARPVPIGRRPC